MGMGALGIAAASGKRDAMQSANLKVLFIAGFGPIVRDSVESRKLYGDALAIRFKEEGGGYLHTEAVPGAKSFALWPLSQAAQSVLEKIPGPKLFLPRRRGLSSMWTVWKRQLRPSNQPDIACSLKPRKNHGAKS